jgi:hypothetical protein
MSMLRWIVRKIALAYLNRQLDKKNTQGFPALLGPWNAGSDSVSLGIYDATCEVQVRLVSEFGYHKCPSCEWATEQPGEHLTPGSWCLEQLQSRSRKFYLLEKRLEKPGHIDQLGIVVAESVEHAAYKLRAKIVSVTRPPVSAVVFAELEDGYCLSGIEEITSLTSPESQEDRRRDTWYEDDDEWTR